MKYLLWINEKGEGPYDKSQVVEMLSSGKITDQTQCLPENGSGDWLPAGTVPGLLGVVGTRSRRRNLSLWIAAGILVLVMLLWLAGVYRTKHRSRGQEIGLAGEVLPKDLSDPVLRDRLTMMIAPLQANGDVRSPEGVTTTLAYLRRTVPPIADDLDAIIAVNGTRMSEQQKQDLVAARKALDGVLRELALTQTGGDTKRSYEESLESLATSKQLLTKAAAEF